MPHTRSAKKNLRKTEKRRLHNRAVKRTIKTEVKKYMDLAESGTADELAKEFALASKKIDKAAAKRIIHPNTASRKKSQLARVLFKKKQGGGAAPAAATAKK